MIKLFLTSSGITTNYLKKEFFKLLDKDPKGMRLCLITTAAHPEIKHEWLDPTIERLKDFGFEVELMDLKDEDTNDLKDKLSSFDIIYVNGGNTFKLLKYSRKSGFGEIIGDILEQGKVYVGVSAGSILVGPNIEMAGWESLVPDENVVNLKELTGIDLINLAIFPHFVKENRDSLTKESVNVDYPIIAITEDQAVIAKDDKWEIVGKGEKIIYNQ